MTLKELTKYDVEEREKEAFSKGFPETDKLIGLELDKLVKLMEEMAGAPREEMGKREPGERGMYERYDDKGLRKS